MRNLVLAGVFYTAYAVNEVNSQDQIPLNPSALSGILVVLMLLVFLFGGIAAMAGIQGPSSYSNVPLLIGKEK